MKFTRLPRKLKKRVKQLELKKAYKNNYRIIDIYNIRSKDVVIRLKAYKNNDAEILGPSNDLQLRHEIKLAIKNYENT